MQKMSEKEALEMLKAKLTCMKLEALSCIEKGCDKDCDMCEYNYKQGNMGEQKDALATAIKALEEIQQYRAIGTVEELKELKYNGAFSGIELANIAASLAELQKYQVIGTVDQCREAVERMKGEEHE